jgi:hypothetical protein
MLIQSSASEEHSRWMNKRRNNVGSRTSIATNNMVLAANKRNGIQ